MKAGLVIETIKGIKQTAIDKQMYELASYIREIERELSNTYEDEVQVSHLTVLLQSCLTGLPDDQRLLLTPIIRELKLNYVPIMIPTASDIILHSGLHKKRVHNIYVFGSTVYGTNSEKSDIDVIMVANNSVEAIEFKGEKYNIHIYTPDKFKEDLEWHRINNLECIFAPTWAKIQENIKYDLDIDSPKLRHATSHISSNSWVKCKKKLEIGDYYTGIKSIFHSLRIPMFATQVATKGTIYDFEVANPIWDKLMSKEWTWKELDNEFREMRNVLLIEFRKVCEK